MRLMSAVCAASLYRESAMPFAPATVISRSGKPHSCAAPFVVLFVCILWQVVKAIMVDKETGFKVGHSYITI